MRLFLAALLITLSLLSCSKWDDYKKYTAGGEIVYSGKLDSVKAYSGKNRVRITGRLNADPKIKAVKIFWNNNADSLVYDIKRSVSGNVFDQTFPMPESITTFTVYTYDTDGNKSVAVYVVGKSFGDSYRRKISNRIISNIRYMSNNTTIAWEAVDPSLGAIQTELQYVINGVTKDLVTPAADNSVFDGLPNTNTLIRYRGVFKPDSTAIDTFKVAYKDTVVIPIKNNRMPFIASARAAQRWGNLAEWNFNDSVKNHGGYGGWDENNGNVFNIESGWGAPAITNGKLWQTFLLEPGNYIFEISDLLNTNFGNSDNTYLVVAQGTELPDITNLGAAINTVKIKGQPVDQLRVPFAVSTKSQITVGYITTQPGGAPAGKFCNIRAFSVYTTK
ncbi:MAG TPA: DUF4998 domain-containing protein [Niastella sp.]